MKKYTNNHLVLAILIILGTALTSCKKAFDLQPKSEVDITNNYQNVYDVNAAVIGIYGQFMKLAEQYVVLNELRGDLMETTPNSDKYLLEISQHKVTAGNPWADPRPFYKVIVNCNDVLYNLKLMLAANKINQSDFDQRYSDVGALRSFLYLQLGIHFGSVPYVTEPLANINDLKNTSKFERVPFKSLIDSLVTFTAALPYLEPYSATTSTTSNPSTSLVTTADGYLTKYNFISKRCLLGDLYLWQGTNFKEAARQYRIVMEYQTNNSNITTGYQTYKIAMADIANNNDLTVGYLRNRTFDINSLINSNTQGWRSIFARPQDALYDTEWLWAMTFDSNFSPVDPFIDLFSNQGGRYLVQPSQNAISNWNSQTQLNGFPFDQRGPFTYKVINGNPVIVKYLYYYLDANSFAPIKILQQNGKWFLYRAETLNLHYAEAANRDGRGKLAFAMLNSGIKNIFNGVYPNPVTLYPLPTDVTNIEQTFDSPPYDFDARQGDAPRYRSSWYQNTGIRGRAYLTDLNYSLATNTQGLEDALIQESALTLAYEGQRWPDLLRIALRRNDPSFLANKVADRLNRDGFGAAAGAAQAKLSSGDYYLPFNW
ncbi:RagB/SusD family protein [Mucilaginibacter sp. HMF5004]|uniref:RagB/SusD family nutrient uptake outer membrane protein n=1 Tax=Mucilaginibacter rivuli TaxID=2857527 RepID=UPI001C5F3CF6|nr:RagB/SusD family nutrient uptake outer membrane protein [Mucilaginibacter rivuli]MBW4888973.1 RagB/SusD family protein [Mucilaginibacter rivuli]